MQRSDGRAADQVRDVSFELNIAPHASGSVLVAMGNTRVICGVMIEEVLPRWMKESRPGGITGGWLTAEYSMLPYSTTTRKPRDIMKGRLDGRSTEIQRLIGRSLRGVVDLEKLGPRTIWVDCDVLQADGGTRTAAITGASLAVTIACRKLAKEKKLDAPPIKKLVAAVSAGILDGNAIVDLNYEEDKAVTVDFNLVATEDGDFVEVQGSGEEATFAQAQLDEMVVLARPPFAKAAAWQAGARLHQISCSRTRFALKRDAAHEKGAHHGYHWSGWELPRRSLAREGIRSPRHHSPREHV